MTLSAQTPGIDQRTLAFLTALDALLAQAPQTKDVLHAALPRLLAETRALSAAIAERTAPESGRSCDTWLHNGFSRLSTMREQLHRSAAGYHNPVEGEPDQHSPAMIVELVKLHMESKAFLDFVDAMIASHLPLDDG